MISRERYWWTFTECIYLRRTTTGSSLVVYGVYICTWTLYTELEIKVSYDRSNKFDRYSCPRFLYPYRSPRARATTARQTIMPTLHWIGKEKVQTHHNDVPYRVLKQQYTYGNENNTYGDDAFRVVKNIRAAGDAGASPAVVSANTDNPSLGWVGEVNKIIHGDNLEALKALLPEYENRVDCIYIDPPYNTGNEGWVYNDNVNDPHIRKWLGAVVGKEAEDLTRHDKWLCMMYPRLVLLQKLLSPTGVMFISIDDFEQTNLKEICHELFGVQNVEQYIWCLQDKSESSFVKTAGLTVRKEHEYIIACFNKTDTRFSKYTGQRDFTDSIQSNPDNDPRGPWFSGNISRNGIKTTTGTKYYTITNPAGESFTRNWTLTKEEYEEALNDNRIYFAKNGAGVPRLKIFPTKESQLIQSSLFTDVHTSITGKKELNAIFGDSPFPFPKPTALISRLLQIATHKDALILDSFAGSGTTAHAVLNLNKQDGGHRRFILVEMCDYAETITAERVRRVIDGYGEGSKAVEGTGGSFAFYELGDTIYDPQTSLLNDHADPEQIRRYIWYSETNTPYHSPKDCTDDGAAGDAGALARGRFGTNRMTMPYMGDDASRVVSTHPYLLGRKDGTNYYFYYKRGEETVLDRAFLNTFTPADQAEQYIIYADCCRLSRDFMQAHHITFKQIPRDIKKV